MAYGIVSNGVAEKTAARLRAKAGATYPVIWKFGIWIANEARRRAPVGHGRFRGALRKSLNCVALSDRVTQLQSATPYAKIQEKGRTVTAGKGPLGSKLLAIPLNATAEALLAGMGAGVSLKDKNLLFLKTRRGRMVLIQQPPPKGPRAKVKRGAARAHRMFGGQVLFLLVPSVTIPPQHYAPRMSEPAVRGAAAKFIREHLRSP
jgi:hypothetical protein